MTGAIRLEQLEKTYSGGVTAVRPTTLEIRAGELLAVVGPSGCGKSTLLRMVAGLEMPTGGRLWIGDRDATRLPPEQRDIAMVFQSYALYPHKSVRDNLAFPLRMRKTPPPEIARRVADVADVLGLTPLLDRRPRALSGGQRQRVALGRAMVREPAAFLLDEPLSNLDAQLRVETRAELKRMQRALKATMLYVTHDQEEALTLGDRVAVMHRGELQQVAPPLEVYHRPASLFVAGFIGSPAMNLFEGTIARTDAGASFTSAVLTIPFAPADAVPGAGPVTLGIRPPDIELVESASDGQGVVDVVEPAGATTQLHVRVGELGVRVLLSGTGGPREGERVGLRLRRDACHWFERESGKRLE